MKMRSSRFFFYFHGLFERVHIKTRDVGKNRRFFVCLFCLLLFDHNRKQTSYIFEYVASLQPKNVIKICFVCLFAVDIFESPSHISSHTATSVFKATISDKEFIKQGHFANSTTATQRLA